MATKPIDKYADVIDSRDVIARIEELQGRNAHDLTTDELYEFLSLERLQEAANISPDWEHGETLIHDLYFRQYAMELVDERWSRIDILHWPFNCIAWDQAIKELQMDYIAVEYMGQTFWIQA